MEFSFTFECVIGGHHVYKFVWTPFIRDILSLSAEHGNENDPSQWLMKDSAVIGQCVLMLEYIVQVETIAYK